MKLGQGGIRWIWDGVGRDGSGTGWDEMKLGQGGIRWIWDGVG